MIQKHKKLIVFTLIFSFLLLGTGVFLNKNKEVQASDGEMLTMLRGMNQVLGLIAEKLTVISVKDGSVGIGTTDPWRKLTVMGNKNENAGIVVAGYQKQGEWPAATVSLHDRENRVGFTIRNHSTNNDNLMQFGVWEGDHEKYTVPFTMTKNGNVGIGTTNPTHLLHVNGIARANQASFATTSDIKLKDINEGYTKGLEEVLGINPVIFNYKKDNPLDLDSNKEFVGVIAQELKSIIPEAVEEAEDGYLTVNNDAVMWAMVNGIKEQQKEIDELRSLIKELR